MPERDMSGDWWINESIRDQTFEDLYSLGKELGR